MGWVGPSGGYWALLAPSLGNDLVTPSSVLWFQGQPFHVAAGTQLNPWMLSSKFPR